MRAARASRLLGPQPQARIHAEARSALCTFVPNFVIPETFGLVFAESPRPGHAGAHSRLRRGAGSRRRPAAGVATYPGVPPLRGCGGQPAATLAAAAGAAGGERAGLFDAYLERIRAWRGGERPRTGPDPRFRLSTVTEQWRALLFVLSALSAAVPSAHQAANTASTEI